MTKEEREIRSQEIYARGKEVLANLRPQLEAKWNAQCEACMRTDDFYPQCVCPSFKETNTPNDYEGCERLIERKEAYEEYLRRRDETDVILGMGSDLID